MKNIKTFEKFIWEVNQELEKFTNKSDIKTIINNLLLSVEAYEIDRSVIFPLLKGDENIKELNIYKPFLDNLEEKGLKLSDLFDTDVFTTTTNARLRFYWIYSSKSTTEIPVYLLMKYFDNDWSDLKLYYVQKNTKYFLDYLSTCEIDINYNNKTWKYKTSDSGVTWLLISDNETSTFKSKLKMEDIISFSNHPNVELNIM